MKYIIDIPKEYESDWVNKSSRLGFELCFPINETATNKKYHIPTGLKLESYTELDREAIENEVWNFVRFMSQGMSSLRRKECFGFDATLSAIKEMPYQEAKAKHEAWKKGEEDRELLKEVTALAERVGVHKLYSMVKEIRGE